MAIQDKYIEKLKNIPVPGFGLECHPYLQGVANYGIMAGITPEELFSDMRASIPAGKRKISDKEIWDAINKATEDIVTLPNGEKYQRYFTPKQKPQIKDGAATLRRIIEKSEIREEVDLWELSPIRIDWPPEEDMIHFLPAMYELSDQIFISEHSTPGVVGHNIGTVEDWIKHFQAGGKTAPHIIVNPLNGLPAPKKTGEGVSFRGDNNVQTFKYCLVEFDTLSREDQIRFWTSKDVQELPIAALIDTGGKSIHAWIKTPNIKSMTDWQREIRSKLYEQVFIPLGVDSACSNPARLSRLPGHLRGEKYQRILWLNSQSEDGEK